MKRKRWLRLVILSLLAAVGSPGQASAQGNIGVTDVQLEPVSRLYTLIKQYEADKEALDREYVLEESTQYYERMTVFYEGWLEKMSTVDYGSLSVNEAVDFILLRRNIRRDREELQEQWTSFKEIRSLIPFVDIIQALQQKRSVGQDLDGQELGRQLTRLAEAILQNRRELKASGRLSLQHSNRAVEAAKNLDETLENIYTFYVGYDPDVTWWGQEPYENVDTTLANYISFLEEWKTGEQYYEDDESGIAGDPVGRDELMDLLQYAMIPYTPEELIEIARKEYAWCMDQMLAASRDLGYGDDWKAALEHVKNTYVPPGEQPELIYELATGAINFLEERDLVTIPKLARSTWRMEMMTPERQLINPYFLGGEIIRISYPTNTMDHGAKLMSMRGNNPHFSKATVHHELIAGHYLQAFYSERYNAYRDPFSTPFWGEGWALYWELQLWDLGYPDSPEDRIGMLFWRMHRCARIIFSLSFHLGEMSPEEAIDFLVENVGHEVANAEAEVRRSVATDYPPLYQAAYLLGGLQIRSMYEEMVVNGDMPVKTFHDTILKEGSMPIEMIRYLLKDQKPPKDFETKWRFYEDFDYRAYD